MGDAGLGKSDGQDTGGKELSEAHDGIETGRAQFADQADALRDAPQRFKQLPDLGMGLLLAFGAQEFVDDDGMALLQLVDEGPVAVIAAGRPMADFNQGIGAFADGRADQDGAVALDGCGDDIDHPAHGAGIGDRGSSEFQDLHSDVKIVLNCSFSNKKPSWPKREAISW